MKKIFIVIVSLIFVTSCSNEEANKLESHNELNEMYRKINDIESTEEFINFKITFSNYLKQLNTNPDYQEEKDLLINLNVENLENIDINNTRLNESVLKLKNLYSRYGLFSFSSSHINNPNNEFQNFVIEDNGFDIAFDPNNYQTNGGPCEFGCINDAVSCSNTVNSIYNTQMNLAGRELIRGNAFGAAVMATIARIQQGIGQSNCSKNLTNCMDGC